MSFIWDAGSTTATYAGRVEFNGLRLNDGTVKTQVVPPIVDQAPVESVLVDLPSSDGGYPGATLLRSWQFDIECWLWVPSGPDDIPAALDYIRSFVNPQVGYKDMLLGARGWTDTRIITCRAGSILVEEPDTDEKKVPLRKLTIPFYAPDPRRYASTLQDVPITTSTNVTNAGNTPSPFVTRFTGTTTLVNPELDGPGTAGTNRIRYVASITAANWVEVNTSGNTTNGMPTALDNTGASVYSALSAFTAETIPVGTSAWTFTQTSGTGTAEIKFRNAWL